MTPDILLALATFALVSSITPGPNNLMLMASGANFGLRRSLPHMFGVAIGFVLMVAVIGLGLVGALDDHPGAFVALKAVALVYLVWLAWKIATARPAGEGAARSRPLTFVQAAAFQWVNPKAWAMALTAVSAYMPDRTVATALLVAGVFGLVNLPSISTWTIFGQQMRRVLTNPTRLRVFNLTMAALLLATLWPILRA